MPIPMPHCYLYFDSCRPRSVRLTFDERQALLDNLDYLCKSLGLRHLHVTSADEGAEGAQEAMPGIPVVRWDTEEVAK